jgi:hypothetical protein
LLAGQSPPRAVAAKLELAKPIGKLVTTTAERDLRAAISGSDPVIRGHLHLLAASVTKTPAETT